jgi:hypothetical protein
MTYEYAVRILGAQTRNLRKVNGTRFEYKGYEYRVTWYGGFASYVGIDRRQVGKRNFKDFAGAGASGCWTVQQVMELVMRIIEEKA